jgi:radical SAM protein with 4Fe4S-binding SPASM domain
MSGSKTIEEKLFRITRRGRPVTALVEVTGRCNASCPYCYIKQERPVQELSTADLLKVIDKLYEAQVLGICISGGEPFARKDILDVLARCIERDFFKVSVLTNGTILSKDHLRFLAQHRRYFSFVRMSAFSHRAEVHDAYCGVSGALAALVENGLRLMADGLRVGILVNVMDFNVDDIAATTEFFMRQGFVTATGIRKLAPSPALRDMADKFTTQEFYESALERFSPRERAVIIEKFEDQLRSGGEADALCAGLSSTVTVDYRGDVIPCVSFRTLVLGSLLGDKGLLDILNSSREYQALRQVRKSDIDGCKLCGYAHFCEPCLGMIYSRYGSVHHAPEQFCNYAKALSNVRNRTCDLTI